ncbi:MAG TPA: cyclase family protein [Thermoanaerobaculia bacterium]
MSGRRIIDLSHPIEAGMTTYPGLPGPAVSDFWSRESTKGRYAPGTTFQIGRVEMVANTGTYVDAPFHRFAKGTDVAGLPLIKLADLPGTLIDATRAGRALEAEIFRDRLIRDRAVLVRTDWDRHWRTPQYAEGHPYLTRGAAELLVREGAALVGIDSLNIDDATDLSRPVHTLLLEAGIPVVEHLTRLSALPSDGFRFHAVPAPVAGMGSFPVRAYAVL